MRIIDRGNKVVVLGDAVDTERVGGALERLLAEVRKGHTPTHDDVSDALSIAGESAPFDMERVWGELPAVLRRDIPIKPRTRGQKRFIEAIRTHAVVLAVGPAGTGKTFLSMAAAVSALLNKEVRRLVLTRPAVEAGENLGYLPGDFKEKFNPYLMPLYDALDALVSPEQAQKFYDRDQVEVAPLAYMRGRTLSNCFAILDEAQNTTPEQMKMFLTRLGEGSRVVITGDVTQIDLARGVVSGLVEATRILGNTDGIAIVHLSKEDIVRHRLVQNIVDAYEADDAGSTGDRPAGKA